MPVYEKPPDEIRTMVDTVLEQFHPDLHKEKLRVDILFAKATTDSNGETIGSALVVAGHPVDVMAKVVGLKDRHKGNGDVEIHIDGDHWDGNTEPQQMALIDHALQHFKVVLDKESVPKRDDCNRPKIRLRRHDHRFVWFDAVARRHGTDSLEIREFKKFSASQAQLWLEFSEPTPLEKARAEKERDDKRGGTSAGKVKKAAAASK